MKSNATDKVASEIPEKVAKTLKDITKGKM